MNIDIGFSEQKLDGNYYTVLLPLIGEHYCKNYFDGFLYVYKNEDLDFEDIIENLLSMKINKIINVGKIRFNKELDALLCLLVNPYFDKTYDFLKNHYFDCSKNLLKILRTQIFTYLASEKTNQLFKINYVEGSDVYCKFECYQKSKELLSLLNN